MLFQKMAADNPKMQLVAQLMQQQQQQAQQSESSNSAKQDNQKGKVQKLLAINQNLKKQIQKLKKQKEKYLSYLDYFFEVNSVFASAVGACECWGEDEECEKCNGAGKPGFYKVNQDAFEVFVLPCIEKQNTGVEKEVLHKVAVNG